MNAQSVTKKNLRGKWWASEEINVWDDTVSNKAVQLKSFRNWKYVDKKYKKAEGFYFMPNGILVHQFKQSSYSRYRDEYKWILEGDVVQVFNKSGVREYDMRILSVSDKQLEFIIENRIERDIVILRAKSISIE